MYCYQIHVEHIVLLMDSCYSVSEGGNYSYLGFVHINHLLRFI